ncbi:MAG: carboxypeptidase-like regulatory domain-containing protein [Bacteroidia bacterium]|nr:carboxypeptidase-like regulatory domain-containing protein [Bacteroidia bacterium]
MSYKRFIILFILLINAIIASAQVTKVRGKITDAQTNEPLPFVNITYLTSSLGTIIGTITDFNGDYFLETRTPTDTLVFSYIGYYTQKVKIKKNAFQTIDIQLQPQQIMLSEVTVVPGENPAFRILREITAHKDINDKKNLEAYQCEVYNKIEMDANNIGEKLQKRKVFNQFQFIFDYMDTSAVSGKSYLPVFFVETVSDYYYRKLPLAEKEIIKANRISGIQNESVTQFSGKMFMDFDIYSNYIPVIDKSFISPIASFGRVYYKYYLIDSAFIDNQWCYQISFKPKSKTEPCFNGDIWVHDTTFAIKKAKLRLSKEANINWVQDLVAEIEVDKKMWMISKDQLLVDFNVTEDKTVGFFGRKTTSYNNYILNQPYEDKFYTSGTPESVVILKDALEKDETYWGQARHDSLSEREKNIYKMVDSIQDVPLFRTYVDVITTIVTGYLKAGKFEIGPYIKLYSFNDVEGHRIKFGGRTSSKLSNNLFIDGHIAYGTKDEKFKYSIGVKYHFSKLPFRQAGLSYKDDMEQLGESPDALQEDNLLGSIFRREHNFKLNHVIEYNAFYEHEWFSGFSNTLSLNYRILDPLGNEYDNFRLYEKKSDITDTICRNNLKTSEVSLLVRFAYNEKFIIPVRERISLGTIYPVLKLKYSFGLKDIFGSDYTYHKIRLYFQYDFNINPIGYMDANMGVGKIFGKLPYPLLEMHMGNETYWYDDFAFNTMNYYEFVSDAYIEFNFTHYFDGFFFNKIPLFRRLRLREVALVHGVVGTLSDENRDYSQFPVTLSGLTYPYIEAGIGVENIFQILRIDMLWRLSYLSEAYRQSKNVNNDFNIMLFGIRARFDFKL